MTAFEEACDLYSARDFTLDELKHDMLWHVMHGYLLATPCEFVMARPVVLGWGEDRIVDSADNRLTDLELTLSLDCWHITVAVGDMRELLSHLPYHLPFISFERRDKFRVYPLSRFL